MNETAFFNQLKYVRTVAKNVTDDEMSEATIAMLEDIRGIEAKGKVYNGICSIKDWTVLAGLRAINKHRRSEAKYRKQNVELLDTHPAKEVDPFDFSKLSGLSKRQKTVTDMLATGESYQQIADAKKVTRKAVRDVVYRAKKKITPA